MSDLPRLTPTERAALPADGGPGFNRLIFEKSPYLLQHATNPVDWHAWGPEVLAQARREDRPIFLSIGYSTCHWCHVMAAESFADPEVAAVLNRHFLPVKVDREERPDLDNAAMAACQLLTGQGGWPLNVVLTPQGRPFFAATYLPRQPRHGLAGVISVLEQLAAVWRERRQQVEETAAELSRAVLSLEQQDAGSGPLHDRPLRQALADYRDQFDATHGGFGTAPKFPAPHNLSLLLRLHRRSGDTAARDMALATLTAMHCGGITDQLGGGLHRYSVDARWRVPHFEKMLYDQALVAQAYLDAWQVSGDSFFAAAAGSILDYVGRDLVLPEGGIACGEDADSEGREGTFYLWTPAQVREILGSDDGELVCRLFGITATGDLEGESVPHQSQPLAALAAELGLEPAALAGRREELRQRLLTARSRRPRPHRDDKVLAGWNGLIIGALARGAALAGRRDWLECARRAAEFVWHQLRREDGRLLRRWREGEMAVPAFLEDYAFFAQGLLELHQTDFDDADRLRALWLCGEAQRLFGDGAGGCYDIDSDGEELLGRGRSQIDGAIPCGASVLATTLLRLGRLSGDEELWRRGEVLLAVALPQIERQPTAHAHWLSALDLALGGGMALTVSGDDGPRVDALLVAARRGFRPHLLLQRQREGEPAAGLCRTGRCLPPVTQPAALEQLLDEE